MALKGFPESAKFRHLFVPDLFQLRRSVTVKTISLSFAEKRGGERAKWFKMGAGYSAQKNYFGGLQRCFVQPAFRVYPDMLFGYVVNLS